MGRKKCWEQNFNFFKNFGFLDPNMLKKWLFWDFFDFPARQIEKMGQKRVKIENLFPTFFQMFLSRSQSIFTSNGQYGLKLLIVL